MQEHGGTAAEEVITSSERRFLHEIQVDWNQNGLYDHPLSNIGEFADNIEVDRQLSGTAPSEILLIEGSAAAELRLDLGGEYQGIPLTGVFSPYNVRSPFFGEEMVGAEIKYRIGVETPVGVFWYPQFIGNVRTVTPRRGDNVVEITALDRVEKLRRPVLLPPWAVSDIHVNYGELDSQLCRSHWVIDNALRLCDVSPSPKRPVLLEEVVGTAWEPREGEGLQFYVTGNGGYLPTVGWMDNPSAMTFPADGTPMYQQVGPKHPEAPASAPRPLALAALNTPLRESGPFISPAEYQGIIRYWMESRDILIEGGNSGYFNVRPNASHYMGFTINTNGTNGQLYRTVGLHTAMEVLLGNYFSLMIDIEKGRIRTRFQQSDFHPDLDLITRTGAWQNLPTGVDHIDVFLVWDTADSSGFGWRMLINGVDTGWIPAGSYVARSPHYDAIGGRITIGQALSLSDIYYGSMWVYDPWFDTRLCYRPAKYRAELDIGKNRLTSMPYQEPKEAWQIITEVASAEMGAVFWDEQGVFRFWNLDTIQGKQGNIVRRLSLDQASDLIITNSLDSIRNVYTVDANRKRAVTHRTIFEADDVQQFVVPSRTVKYFRIWVGGVQSPLPFKLTRHLSGPNLGAPEWTDASFHGYCVQFYEDGQWAERPELVDGVDINVYFTKDGALIVRIWNGYQWDARLAAGITNQTTDNSQPAFRITGTEIIDDPNETVWVRDVDSIKKYGARNLALSGEWYQDSVEGSELINQLVQRTSRPTPTTDAIEIAGDPRLQLGDTIALYDPQGLGNDVRIQILGINRRYSRDEGLTDTLTVEMINPAGRPPTVNAGEDLTLTVGERRVIRASYLDYGAPNVSFGWEIIAGPNRVGEVQNGDEFEFVPTAEGDYELRFSLDSDYGSASDTVIVHAVPQGTSGGGGGGGPVPANPGEALWIGRTGGNWYNVGLGVPGGHTDYDWDDILNGFSDPNRFYLNAAGNVEFKVKITEGRTSTNTKYPRSELRELNIQGANGGEIAWNGTTGTHYMKGRSRVRQVTQIKPSVCFFQIHDASSDLVRVQTFKSGSGLALQAKYTKPGGSTETTVTVMSSYDIDQWVDWYIEVVNGRLRIELDGVEVLNVTGMGTSGCYFKHGAYAQSAVNNVTDTEEGNGNQWFVVETQRYSFETWHSGYPAPTTPGGSSEPVPSEPFSRLYLSNQPAEWMPQVALSMWQVGTTGVLTNAKGLTALPEGASLAVPLSESVTTAPYHGLVRQFVSAPADADGVLRGKIRIGLGSFQSHADANLRLAASVWISQGNTATIRGGTGYTMIATEPVGTIASGWEIELDLSETAKPETPFLAGDHLVVELGFQAMNTTATTRTYTQYIGGDGDRDLRRNDTDMALPSWIDIQTTGGAFGSLIGPGTEVPDDPGDPGEDPPGTGPILSFGKSTDGANQTASSADKMAASRFTPTASGKLLTGHARLWLSAAGTAGARLLVYADNAGSPGTLLATSNEVAVTNTTEAVKDFTFSGTNQISIQSGTPYWLAIMWDDPGTPSMTFSRGADPSGRVEMSGFTYPAAPNPFGTPAGPFDGPVDVWVDYQT